MRTTLAINEHLLEEVKALSGAKTKKEAVERAMKDYIHRRKSLRLLDLEGKVELSYTTGDLIKRRRKDVPHR
jgi:Arc/MetJ family transcription regulator